MRSHQHSGIESLAESLHHRQDHLGKQLLARLGVVHPVDAVKLKGVLGLNASAFRLLGELNLHGGRFEPGLKGETLK